jgi:hypothetical protein
MSKRKPAPAPVALTDEILSHRRGFERFVLEPAEQTENDLAICD